MVSPTPSGPVTWTPVLGWGLLAAFVLGAVALGDIYGGTVTVGAAEVYRIRIWQGLYVAGFAGYLMLLASFRRGPVAWRTVIVAAALLRLLLLFCPPNEDCNRYAWEGRIQNLGFNPFSTSPLDERLEPFRDDVWQSINKKSYTTIYPPLAQLEFRLLATLHGSVKALQVAHTVLDFAVVLALAGLLRMMGRPAGCLALYALCPLTLAAFAHAGHNDPLMILALIGFLAAAKRERWLLAGAALGLAVLAKTVPAILLALLVRRSWRAACVTILVVAAGYSVYMDAGSQLVYTLHHFPSQDHFNSVLDEFRMWLNAALDSPILARDRNLLCLALLAGAALYRAVRPREIITDARWLIALVVLLLPIVHFWYLSWPLALIALKPRGYGAWIVLAGTSVLYWQAQWSQEVSGHWRLAPWIVMVIWLPFFIIWAAETAENRLRHEPPGIGPSGPDKAVAP